MHRKGEAVTQRQPFGGEFVLLHQSLEGGDDVMGALIKIETLHRPDDYYVQLPNRYRAMTAADLDKAARAAIDPRNLLWVVVGDAAKVRPQLDKLGMPVELMPLE